MSETSWFDDEQLDRDRLGHVVAPVLERVERALLSHRLPHALLLAGPPGLGRELVDEAERRQILSTERSGMDVLITLTPDSTDGQPPAVDQAAPTVEEPNSILLKRFFESKLRCDWPDRKLRKKIFAELDRVLEEKQDPKESIALVTLAGMIAERLDSDSLTDIQPIVFKVLYSLFRARGFRCFLSEQAYNPLILGPLSDVTDWDELFIRNNLVVLRRERPDWPFEASDIATIFEIREARAQEIIRDTFGTENG